eukprot:CFRG1148T1
MSTKDTRRKRRRRDDSSNGICSRDIETDDLVDVYQRMLKRMQEEREELTARLLQHQVQANEHHDLQRTASQHLMQIVQLERTVTNTQKALHEERLKGHSMQEEVLKLRALEKKDRQTIQLLIADTKRPDQNTNASDISQPHRLQLRHATLAQPMRASDQEEREFVSLKRDVGDLRKRLADQKLVYTNRIAQLESDLRSNQDSHLRRTASLTEQTKILAETLRKTRSQLSSAIREIVQLQDKAMANHLYVAKRREEFNTQSAKIKQEAQSLNKESERDKFPKMDVPVEELEGHYRSQLIEKERELSKMQSEHDAFQLLSKVKHEKVERQLLAANRKLRIAERDRKREKEGYEADLISIRHQVDTMQSHMLSLTKAFTGPAADRDILALRAVHNACLDANKVAGDLRQLKERVEQVIGDEN